MSGQAARIAGLVLATLAALALLIAAVALLTRSDDNAPVKIVAPEPSPAALPDERDIRVQVGGAVMSPGVYAMNDGDRVMDAIAAAGGVNPDADISAINLARRVQDEAHYYIPFVGETPPPSVAPSAASAAAAQRESADNVTPLVDLNTASAQELESLPGIGPVMADRIIAYRETNGLFISVDSVKDVPSIGPKTVESIRALVTVSGRP